MSQTIRLRAKAEGLTKEQAQTIIRYMLRAYKLAEDMKLLDTMREQFNLDSTYYRLSGRFGNGRPSNWAFDTNDSIFGTTVRKQIIEPRMEGYEFCKGTHKVVAIRLPGETIMEHCYFAIDLIDDATTDRECSFEYVYSIVLSDIERYLNMSGLKPPNVILYSRMELARLHIFHVHLLEAIKRQIASGLSIWDDTWYHKGEPSDIMVLRWKLSALQGMDEQGKFENAQEHDIKRIADAYSVDVSKFYGTNEYQTTREKILALRQKTEKPKIQADVDDLCERVFKTLRQKPTSVRIESKIN